MKASSPPADATVATTSTAGGAGSTGPAWHRRTGRAITSESRQMTRARSEVSAVAAEGLERAGRIDVEGEPRAGRQLVHRVDELFE